MHSTGQKYVLFGLVPLIWFGALHQALYDYWAMTLAFAWISLLAIGGIEVARRESRRLKFPLLTSWLLLVAAGWLSLFHSFDVTTTLWEAWGWTYGMIVFYIVVNCADAFTLRRFFLIGSGSVVVLLGLAAIHQQLHGSPTTYGDITFQGRTLWHYGRWEIHATLVNSIVFAGFLLSWSLTFWPFAPRRSPLNWIPFTPLVIGIVLARSWTACLCLTAGLAFYNNHLYGTPLNRRLFIRILLATGAIGLFMIFWKLLQSRDGQNYVPSMRILYWKTAIRMFLSYPLTGIGLGGYATAFPYFKRAVGENTLFAHGLVWQIMSETGLVGMLACATGLAEFAHHAKTTFGKNGLSSEDFSLCVTVGTLLAFGMTTIYFDYPLNKFTFIIFAGFLCARFPTRAQMSVRPLRALLLAVTLIACSSFWASLFRAEQLYASGNYANALTLNPHLANAWAKMADLEKDPAQARRLRFIAWHWKKDRAFLLANRPKTSPR